MGITTDYRGVRWTPASLHGTGNPITACLCLWLCWQWRRKEESCHCVKTHTGFPLLPFNPQGWYWEATREPGLCLGSYYLRNVVMPWRAVLSCDSCHWVPSPHSCTPAPMAFPAAQAGDWTFLPWVWTPLSFLFGSLLYLLPQKACSCWLPKIICYMLFFEISIIPSCLFLTQC